MANHSQRASVKLKPRYPRLRLMALRQKAADRIGDERTQRAPIRVSSGNRTKTRH